MKKFFTSLVIILIALQGWGQTPPPAPDGWTSWGQPFPCVGSRQTYTVTPVSTATSYTWYLPGGWSGTSTTNSIVVTIGSASGNISVKANNAYGSSSPISLPITVSEPQPLNVYINSPTTSFTPGSPITFTATPGYYPLTNATYNFKINNISVQNGASNTYTTSSIQENDVVSCVLTADITGQCLANNTAISSSIVMSNAKWRSMGPDSFRFTPDITGFSDITTDAAGTPYFVTNNADDQKLCVVKFNGISWESVGARGFSPGWAGYASLAFDDNTLYAAFADYTMGNKVTVMKFDGTNWNIVGSQGFSSSGVTNPNANIGIAVYNHTPYIIYEGDAPDYQATVMKFDGADWVTVGSPNMSNGIANEPSIAIDGNGTLYAAYIDWGNNQTPTVKKFDGYSWVNTGTTGPAGSAGCYYLSLKIDYNNIPVISYYNGIQFQNGVYVAKYINNAWQTIGSITNDVGNHIAIDSSNAIYLTSGRYQTSWDNTIRRFDGRVFQYIDEDRSAFQSPIIPPIIMHGFNRPVIAYFNNGSIFLKQYSLPAALPATNTSLTGMIADNNTAVFEHNNILVSTITPSGASPVSGNVTASVNIDNSVQAYNGQPYVQRHYDIEPAGNAANATATITLYFTQAEFDNYNSMLTASQPAMPAGPSDAAGISNIRIMQYHGTGTAPGNYTGQSVTINPDDSKIIWNNEQARWEITFDVTGFSGFYVMASGNTEPVTLLTFTAELNNHQATLHWSAATEINNAGYGIERSGNGTDFQTIGFVSGHGTSHQKQSYTYTDANPLPGTGYYRLKQTDLDGKFEYSPVVSVSNSGSGQVTIYPNPVKDVFTVQGIHTGYRIKVYSAEGRSVTEQTASGEKEDINIKTLPAGLYFVKISDNKNHIVLSGKIIKK